VIFGIAAILLLGFLNYALNLVPWVLKELGRDPTLTTRTDIWPILLSQSVNPFLGAGFNSFWSGERLKYLWEQYEIIQAHNGYLEIYLNGGILGLILLFVVLATSGWRLSRQIASSEEFPAMQFAFWVVMVTYNYTEAAFAKMGLLWFVFLLIITRYPSLEESSPPDVSKLAAP